SIKIATLNARTINKTTNQTASRNFHKYLSAQRIDILALQETGVKAHDQPALDHLNKSLHAKHSIWTP
ncbi:hypothetical protein BGZ95_007914, partial [Linnemannia exigua]